MKFTGERYIPTEMGQIRIEHCHRYAVAAELVKGKDVLDIACGEGYGSEMLLEKAHTVIGVDVDLETIKHARNKYNNREKLSFKCGSAEALGFKSDVFDAVISFETIEHVTNQKRMLKEIRRVLKKNGILIISSPNRPVYSQESEEHNRFHIKELDFSEFSTLLKEYFHQVAYFGQRMLMGSVIQCLDKEQKKYIIWNDNGVSITANASPITDPVYYIAICGFKNSKLPLVEASVAYPKNLDLVKHYTGFAKWAKNLEKSIIERDDIIKEKTRIYEQQKEKVSCLENHLEKVKLKNVLLKEQCESTTENKKRLNAQIERLKEEIQNIKNNDLKNRKRLTHFEQLLSEKQTIISELESERKRVHEQLTRLENTLKTTEEKYKRGSRLLNEQMSIMESDVLRSSDCAIYFDQLLSEKNAIIYELEFEQNKLHEQLEKVEKDLKTTEDKYNRENKLLNDQITNMKSDIARSCECSYYHEWHLSDKEQMLNAFQSDQNQLNSKVQDLERDLFDVNVENNRENGVIEGRIEKRQNAVESYEVQIASLKLMELQNRELVKKIEKELAFERHHSQAIANSTSWKITRPIRVIKIGMYNAFRWLLRKINEIKIKNKKIVNFYRDNGVFDTLVLLKRKLKEQWIFAGFSLDVQFNQNTQYRKNELKKGKVLSDSDKKKRIVDTMEYLCSKKIFDYDANTVLHSIEKICGKTRMAHIESCLIDLSEILLNDYDSKKLSVVLASELPKANNSKKRNILFITAIFPNPHHGGGNRVINFIKELSKTNEIYLCSSFIKGEDDQALSYIADYCSAIHVIPHWKFVGNQDEIRQWLGEVKIDIVHYEWPDSIKNFHKDFGTYNIFTYMEAVCLRLLMDMKLLTAYSPDLVDKCCDLINMLHVELYLTKIFDARIAVTSKDAQFFNNIYPSQKYVVLNHGVPFDEFVLPETTQEDDVLVFVGNFRHYPNADAMEYFFKEIWVELVKKMPQLKIYVVGENPTDVLLKLNDNKSIIVTGKVDDVRPFIQKATICIAPLFSGAGLRGKVIEYSALRRTFVATSIAVTDLSFEHGIDFLCSDDTQSFIASIIKLLSDKKMREQMQESVFKKAKSNFNTADITKQLCRLYNYIESN